VLAGSLCSHYKDRTFKFPGGVATRVILRRTSKAFEEFVTVSVRCLNLSGVDPR
jgi:hypothetical protein